MKKQLFAGLGCMLLVFLVTAQTQAAARVSLKWSFAMEKLEGKGSSEEAELSSPTIGADGTIYYSGHKIVPIIGKEPFENELPGLVI